MRQTRELLDAWRGRTTRLTLAWQPERRLTALTRLDPTHRVVDTLGRLMTRVIGDPRLPTGFFLRGGHIGIEIGAVAVFEVAVAVMHEAMARDARRPQGQQA